VTQGTILAFNLIINNYNYFLEIFDYLLDIRV